MTAAELAQLAHDISSLGRELGVTRSASRTRIRPEEPRLQAWLDAGHHGTMDYMARHGDAGPAPRAAAGACGCCRDELSSFEAGFAATLKS